MAKRVLSFLIAILVFTPGLLTAKQQGGDAQKTPKSNKPVAADKACAADEAPSVGFEFSFKAGDAAGKISIPALAIEDAPLYYDASPQNLKKGICIDSHEAGWQLPGEGGKSIVAAHNDKEFKQLDKIKTGDKIYITLNYEAAVGSNVIFAAKSEFVVQEIYVYRSKTDDWKAAAYDDTEDDGLVLETCYPLNKRNISGDKLLVKCSKLKTMIHRTSTIKNM